MAPNRLTRVGNGFYGKYAGGLTVKSNLGILSKGADDQIAIFDYFCDESNYETIPMRLRDPYLNIKPLDFTAQKKKNKMKIGLVTHLNTLNCSKAHERVVKQCGEILENLGHEVIKVELPERF